MFELLCITVIIIFAWCNIKQERRRYPPGPRGIPILGYLPFLKPKPHLALCELGKRWGKIFSLKFGSFPVVVLNDFGTIQEAMKLDAFLGRPTHLPLLKLRDGGVAYTSGTVWKEQRRFVLHSLRDYGFGKSTMEQVISGEVVKLVKHISDKCQEPFHPKKLFQVSVLNSIWGITAGGNFELDNENISKFLHFANRAFIKPPVAGPFYFLPWLLKVAGKWIGFEQVQQDKIELEKMITDLVEKRLQEYVPGSESNLLDSYLKKISETLDIESSFSGEAGKFHCRQTLTAIFVAGSDTLSTTLAWSTLYLTKFHAVCNRLRAEIKSVCGNDAVCKVSDRVRMPYTEATMAEILRYSSIVPNSVLKKTTEGVEFQGYYLPEDTIIMLNLYGVHHDRDIWGDPENFRPERFLDSDGNFEKSEFLVPFSLGKRSCIAETMASMEFFLYLTGLVRNFHFKFDSHLPEPGLDCHPGFLLAPVEYKLQLLRSR